MKTRVGLKPLKYVSQFDIEYDFSSSNHNYGRYRFVHKTSKIHYYNYWVREHYIYCLPNDDDVATHVMSLQEAEEIINEHYRYNEVK
jgi:hypothetical protein